MQKTKISPSGLTPIEQKELERRGFFVKKNFGFRDLFLGVVYIFVYLSLAMIPGSMIGGFLMVLTGFENFIFSLLVLIISYPIVLFFLGFIVSGNTFFIKNKETIQLGQIGGITSGKKYKNLFLLNGYFSQIINSGSGGIGLIIYGLLTPFLLAYIIPIVSFLKDNYLPTIGGLLFAMGKIMIVQSSIYFSGFLLFVTFLYLLRTIFQKFHSLSAFGNLGSKIQSLTPRISESSEKIQKELSTDTNFSVLSKGFATLASDFSKISEYVLKLEQIEKKANKGNLFDSEKYIDSLREDILYPLISLQKFLEQKKIELEASPEELKDIQSQKQRIQVQVGGPDILTGNADIQSKRTKPLIRELTENIEKLEVMIGKFS